MAVLGRFPDLSANEVADRTAMDKVAVSRAVARLLELGVDRLRQVAAAGGIEQAGNGRRTNGCHGVRSAP